MSVQKLARYRQNRHLGWTESDRFGTTESCGHDKCVRRWLSGRTLVFCDLSAGGATIILPDYPSLTSQTKLLVVSAVPPRLYLRASLDARCAGAVLPGILDRTSSQSG